MITTAAILARGLGTRMRRDDAAAKVDQTQAAAAATGMKGMIPIPGSGSAGPGRPFLDYVISALADAGMQHVVLVLGPEHESVREYYRAEGKPTRVSIGFAEQAQPIGTANAVLAAAESVGEGSFLTLNADNYYPVDAFRQLAADDSAGTIAFDRDALVAGGNIDAERVRSFAVLDVTDDGRLAGIVEKPGNSLDLTSPKARWVGMNVWAITPAVVDACRRVPKSARGEFELPEAIGLAIREGVVVRAIRMSAPVLDLSSRGDIASVVSRLQGIEPTP